MIGFNSFFKKDAGCSRRRTDKRNQNPKKRIFDPYSFPFFFLFKHLNGSFPEPRFFLLFSLMYRVVQKKSSQVPLIEYSLL